MVEAARVESCGLDPSINRLIRRILVTGACIGGIVLGGNMLNQCSSPTPTPKGDNVRNY